MFGMVNYFWYQLYFRINSLAKEQQIPFLKSLVSPGLGSKKKPTIPCTQDEQATYHKTNEAVTIYGVCTVYLTYPF